MEWGTSFNSLTRFAANGWDVYQGWGLGAERSLGDASGTPSPSSAPSPPAAAAATSIDGDLASSPCHGTAV